MSLSGSGGAAPHGSAVAYDPAFFGSNQCGSSAIANDPTTNTIKPQRKVLTATAQAIDVSSDDKVIVCYQTPPDPIPQTGTDVLTIQKDAGGTPTASISYSYANAVVDYSLS